MATNYVLVPTPYGKLYLPKKGYSAGARIMSYMVDMVEPQLASCFEQSVIANDKILVDIGAAADGWYSIKACRINPKIKIIAIEPSSHEYKWLYQNLLLNGLEGRILPLKVALSNTPGTLNLNGEEVIVMKLDDLLATKGIMLGDVGILKIDVEGIGYDVLKGASMILKEGRPTIFLEVHSEEEAQSKKFLEERNYKVVTLPGDMYIAVSD